ncbi:MAG: hypothetical protein V4689_05660 [Verrucomicrobiota bacterium]
MKSPLFNLNIPRRTAIHLMASMLSFCQALASEVAYTTPRGIYTVKVPGTTPEATQVRTYLGIQLLPDTRFGGRVATVSGNTISFQNFENPTTLADPERKSYVHVLADSGSGRGFVADIEQFRATDIVCSENLVPWIQPWAVVRIRPHPHLIDLLGATNRFGLGSGTDAETADNVVVWDPDAQHERVYYFHSTRTRWEEKDIVADAGRAIFRFPYGFYIVRRSPGTLRIALSGEIGSDAILLPVRPAGNVFSLPVNLSASLDKIVRATGDFPIMSGPNAKSADILTFEEPTTGIQRGPFYHLSRPGASSWREVGVNGSSAPIQPLDFLSTLVLRREGNAGHVFVEGSLDPPPVPIPPLPPNPEPGELPLTAEMPYPRSLPQSVSLTVETSTDLQTWTTYATPQFANGKVIFDLPAGQGRAFYRLKATLLE